MNATAGVVRGLLGEVDALRAIKKMNPRHPGYKHCMVIYDTFIAKSHHGPHICIVTDVFGPDLTYIRSFLPAQRRFFPLALTQRIIKQTLLALDYLHRECKLVHTGNFIFHAQSLKLSLTGFIFRRQAGQRPHILERPKRGDNTPPQRVAFVHLRDPIRARFVSGPYHHGQIRASRRTLRGTGCAEQP